MSHRDQVSTSTLKSQYDDVPLWLWRAARIGLLAIIGLGAVTAILLSLGIANPPRSGTLVQEFGSLSSMAVPANYTTEIGSSIALPGRAYTLEIAAQTSSDVTWGITFKGASPFKVNIDSRGFFSVPPFVPDSTPFIHIHTESNKVALDVDATGQATLRINDEIAWRGAIPAAAAARIHVTGGRKAASQFIIQRIALYISQQSPTNPS
jgi:hypothetical protein